MQIRIMSSGGRGMRQKKTLLLRAFRCQKTAYPADGKA